MNSKIHSLTLGFSKENISAERKEALAPLIGYIRDKRQREEAIRLNFICTHNSRRSHLAQIWAQAMSHHFGKGAIQCFSGGTEATAMFPKVAETLREQGFFVQALSDGPNPVYAVKYDENESAVVCFSKTYDDDFNPKGRFAAIMTCDSADEGCPVVFGAEARFPVKYLDPKAFDGTDLQDTKYAERSLEIGQEMWYVFGSA
jgi:Protein-tyrosine-phosphatase